MGCMQFVFLRKDGSTRIQMRQRLLCVRLLV